MFPQGLVPTVIVYAVNHGFTQTDGYYSGAVTNTVVLGTRSGAVCESDGPLAKFSSHGCDIDI